MVIVSQDEGAENIDRLRLRVVAKVVHSTEVWCPEVDRYKTN